MLRNIYLVQLANVVTLLKILLDAIDSFCSKDLKQAKMLRSLRY